MNRDTNYLLPRISRGPHRIPTPPGVAEQWHLLDEESLVAVAAAWAARRALLVRGEPGIGKTQLAFAIAVALGRPIIKRVVDSQTESRDLLWEFDAVMRLADAQLVGAILTKGSTGDGQDLRKILSEQLDVRRYIRPGPLWWGFNHLSAERQALLTNSAIPLQQHACDPNNGWVILVDEIDKAETDVPNGLLESLGSGEFTPIGFGSPIKIGFDHNPENSEETSFPPPIIIIATNDERVLPAPFLRRCVVLNLSLPKLSQSEDRSLDVQSEEVAEDAPALRNYLVERGRSHFQHLVPPPPEDLYQDAATELIRHRRRAEAESEPAKPGLAEYLDLVRTMIFYPWPDQMPRVQVLSRFIVKKGTGN